MGSISVPAAVAEVGSDAATAAEVADTAATAASAAELSTSTAATIAATASTTAGTASVAGSNIFTLANATTAAGLIGAAGSAAAEHAQGVAQSNDAKMRARQAGLEAGQKQINIRQNMLRALASQNAAAGAAGIGTGGSFGSNVGRQLTQNKSDLLALSGDTSAEESQYSAQAGNAITTGNLKAGSSLLDAGMAAYKGS